MKKTPFTDKHIALGAKMHEFAGYNMPIEYSGIIDEHKAVVEGVGVFDVSHMGEIWVKGSQALAFLQRVTTNDVSKLEIGKAQYTCLTNQHGGIIDDIIVYYYETEKYMLVVNASNIEKDWNWLVKNNTEKAELENASDKTALLAIQGPKALATIQKLTNEDLSQIAPFNFIVTPLDKCGDAKVIISNTGYTGAGGFELYFYPDQGEAIWNAIFEAGKEFDIKPAGLGARDTLRLEMCYCLYGNELNDELTPLEAGLGWATKFVEGKNFIGRAVLEDQKREGVAKKLCAFKLDERGIPRTGYEIVNDKGEVIGNVTSGTMSPLTKEGIGMGYVRTEYAKVDTPVGIRIRNKDIKSTIVKAPFRK